MDLRRALISKRSIQRAVSLVKELGGKKLSKKNHNLMRALEVANRDGVVYEQTKENGVIRIRMMVKKCDLEKFIYEAGVGNDDVLVPSLVEQRLRQLRTKHHAKLVDKKGPYWAPALGSIPEEL